MLPCGGHCVGDFPLWLRKPVSSQVNEGNGNFVIMQVMARSGKPLDDFDQVSSNSHCSNSTASPTSNYQQTLGSKSKQRRRLTQPPAQSRIRSVPLRIEADNVITPLQPSNRMSLSNFSNPTFNAFFPTSTLPTNLTTFPSFTASFFTSSIELS